MDCPLVGRELSEMPEMNFSRVISSRLVLELWVLILSFLCTLLIKSSNLFGEYNALLSEIP